MAVPLAEEIASAAARLVVDEGMEYAQAKRKAARALGRTPRGTELPSNEQVEDEVRSYLELFCADTQPAELRALRELALRWLQRLSEFRPHLSGAVWRGTATRLNDVHLQLYCDDSKAAEIALLNAGIGYDVGSTRSPNGRVIDVLSLAQPCATLNESVTVHLSILDHDDLRGALKRDAHGRSARGDAAALRQLMMKDAR